MVPDVHDIIEERLSVIREWGSREREVVMYNGVRLFAGGLLDCRVSGIQWQIVRMSNWGIELIPSNTSVPMQLAWSTFDKRGGVFHDASVVKKWMTCR